MVSGCLWDKAAGSSALVSAVAVAIGVVVTFE
jgi:hypothetical protein